ncbi:MAG: hypothetical protein JSW54_04660, partial [Fidelibacterota bacterium]
MRRTRLPILLIIALAISLPAASTYAQSNLRVIPGPTMKFLDKQSNVDRTLEASAVVPLGDGK